MKLQDVTLHLVDTNKEICDAFEEHFSSYSNVKIWNQPFQTLPEFDCIVSPANSFGMMTGGIDAHITDFFGKQLMKRVQTRILWEFAGEQPVGTSIIVETGHPQHPFLAHTPTMRVPQIIIGTDNAYRSMKAMLLAVQEHNERTEQKIYSIACSGLGTMIGKMPAQTAVRQMALAYQHVLEPIEKIDWFVATKREKEIIQVTH